MSERMNVLAVTANEQIAWAMKCGSIRMTGFTTGLLDWLPTMIRAYAIDLVVFNATRRWHDHCKIFHGFQKASRARLQRALKICESQGVATKCLDNCAIARFLRDYKTTGEPDFATKAFAMLMLAENKSVAESVDIAGLMQDRDKKISVGLGAGVAV